MLKKRPLAILGLIWGIMSYMMANLFCYQGFNCNMVSSSSDEFVQKKYGYENNLTDFKYLNNESAYIQIAGAGNKIKTDRIILEFKDSNEKDIPVEIMYSQQNNDKKIISKGIWKKHKVYCVVKITPGEYQNYQIRIPSDFGLVRAYYACDNGYKGIGRNAVFFLILSSAWLLWGGCWLIHPVRKWQHKMLETFDGWILLFFRFCYKHIKYFLYFCSVIIVSCLTAWTFEKFGIIIYTWKLAFLIFAIEIVFLLLYLYIRQEILVSIPMLGCVMVLMLGSSIAFLQPAFLGISYDDQTHYENTVYLSRMMEKQIYAADVAIEEDYFAHEFKVRGYDRKEQLQRYDLYNYLKKNHYYTDKKVISVTSAFIAYIPSVIGVLLGRGLGLPFQGIIILGRWMNVLFFAVMTYLSMKNLGKSCLVVLMVALIPGNIYIGANYTYDIWLTAWSMLALSLFLGEWEKGHERIQTKNIYLIPFSMGIALLPKIVYFPLAVPLLFMSRSKFTGKGQYYLYRMLVILVIFMPIIKLILPMIISRGNSLGRGDIRGGEDVNASRQIQEIINNPRKYIMIFWDHLKIYLNPLIEGRMYIGRMGYMGETLIKTKSLLIALILGAFLNQNDEAVKYPWWTRLGVVLLYAVIGFGVSFVMYIEFTPVGLDRINGAQGRYLLPAVFPLLYVCTRSNVLSQMINAVRIDKGTFEKIIVAICISFFMFAVWTQLWRGCLALYC